MYAFGFRSMELCSFHFELQNAMNSNKVTVVFIVLFQNLPLKLGCSGFGWRRMMLLEKSPCNGSIVVICAFVYYFTKYLCISDTYVQMHIVYMCLSHASPMVIVNYFLGSCTFRILHIHSIFMNPLKIAFACKIQKRIHMASEKSMDVGTFSHGT